MKRIRISHPPRDYNGWTECLDLLSSGIPESGTIGLLSQSSCPEYPGVKAFLHARIEKTVNAVIANCIRELRRSLRRFSDTNEIDGVHIAFVRFARDIDSCLFFIRIPFLDPSFRREMRDATEKEVLRFWTDTVSSIRMDVRKTDNRFLEEELFLIKRIRLFKDLRPQTNQE